MTARKTIRPEPPQLAANRGRKPPLGAAKLLVEPVRIRAETRDGYAAVAAAQGRTKGALYREALERELGLMRARMERAG